MTPLTQEQLEDVLIRWKLAEQRASERDALDLLASDCALRYFLSHDVSVLLSELAQLRRQLKLSDSASPVSRYLV